MDANRFGEHGVSLIKKVVCFILHETAKVILSFFYKRSFVAHAGGSELTYGTNPMAFGFPRKDGVPPLIWDQASAFMAR